jgi:hypothetical protein
MTRKYSYRELARRKHLSLVAWAIEHPQDIKERIEANDLPEKQLLQLIRASEAAEQIRAEKKVPASFRGFKRRISALLQPPANQVELF